MIVPQIGSWYRRLDGRLFEVVAVDDREATVEIQHFDGTIGELELEAWHEMPLEAAVAPEDWTGAVDVDQDALPERSEGRGADRFDPLQFVDRCD